MRRIFYRREKEKEKERENENENENERKGKVVVIIDNENFRGSVKKIYPQRNINYLSLIEFLKENFINGEKLEIYLVISLLERTEGSLGIQNFLRAIKNIEKGFNFNKEIDFKLLEVPAKKERVFVIERKEFEMAEISQVDLKVISLAMEIVFKSIKEEEKIKKFILISGDGDYLEMLGTIKEYITDDVTIISSERSCNDVLRRIFNVLFIEDILKENPGILMPPANNQK